MARIATVLLLVTAAAANAAVIGTPRSPSVSPRSDGVSASEGSQSQGAASGLYSGATEGDGGPNAAAGLGGDAAGGGVGYRVGEGLEAGGAVGGGAPSAGADIGGAGYSSDSASSSASASSSSGGGDAGVAHHRPTRTLFDILSIPISVLQSVNQKLNNKLVKYGGYGNSGGQHYGGYGNSGGQQYGGYGNYGGQHYPKRTYSNSQRSSNANSNGANHYRAVGPRSGSVSTASGESSATAGGIAGGHIANFNANFNIPITALVTENRLLNNLGL